MLAKKNRLTKDRDFDLVFKKGRTIDGKFVFFKLGKNDLQISRFGFIIGKKISKKAAVRNKIKRMLREIIKEKMEKIKPGFDIIVGVRPSIIEKDYQDIKKEVENLLGKSKFYI